MPLEELLPVVSQLSHQDKLRLIHFLLLRVASEEGCDLRSPEAQLLNDSPLIPPASIQEVKHPEESLLKQLAATEAVVWSPYDSHEAAETLANLLAAARQEGDA